WGPAAWSWCGPLDGLPQKGRVAVCRYVVHAENLGRPGRDRKTGHGKRPGETVVRFAAADIAVEPFAGDAETDRPAETLKLTESSQQTQVMDGPLSEPDARVETQCISGNAARSECGDSLREEIAHGRRYVVVLRID